MDRNELSSQASEQGTNLNRYTVIPRTLIFIFDQDSVLLLKGSADKKLWAGKFNGIGGHVEPGEDLMASANRELFEESGIKNVDLHFCGEILVDPGSAPGVAIHIFKGETHNSSIQGSQEGQLSWIAMNKIESFQLVKDLYTILPRVYKWKLGDEVLLGLTNYQSGEMVVSFSDSGRR